MAKVFKKISSQDTVKLPERKGVAAHNQYGKEPRGLAVCKKCHAILFKKRWHHPRAKELLAEKSIARKKGVSFVLCPACTMVEKGLYEGEIIIKNVPAKYETQLVHLIANMGKNAEGRDYEDRIIDIKKRGKAGYRVTTTENVLADKIAKKVAKTFSSATANLAYSREPYEVNRVEVDFS